MSITIEPRQVEMLRWQVDALAAATSRPERPAMFCGPRRTMIGRSGFARYAIAISAIGPQLPQR